MTGYTCTHVVRNRPIVCSPRDVFTERKRDRATSNWHYKYQNRCNARLPWLPINIHGKIRKSVTKIRAVPNSRNRETILVIRLTAYFFLFFSASTNLRQTLATWDTTAGPGKSYRLVPWCGCWSISEVRWIVCLFVCVMSLNDVGCGGFDGDDIYIYIVYRERGGGEREDSQALGHRPPRA